MQYIHADLGHRSRGEVVEATLKGSQANFVLLDTSNFNAFKRGRKFRYHGGLAKKSPAHITIPRAGRWHAVAFIPPGHKGRLRGGFRVLPGPMKPLRASSPPSLAPIRQAADAYAEQHAGADALDRAFDVFISHASEDKDAVVRPLASALRDRGLHVWYDEFELTIGSNLRRNIDRGLAASRFGVVVLSKAFFGKDWANYELDGLVTRELSGEQQLILPVWHGVSRDEVVAYSAPLATKLARSTDAVPLDEIADEIAAVVQPDHERDVLE
jgi:hypothetical protein